MRWDLCVPIPRFSQSVSRKGEKRTPGTARPHPVRISILHHLAAENVRALLRLEYEMVLMEREAGGGRRMLGLSLLVRREGRSQ
jgi:hypothetical protein